MKTYLHEETVDYARQDKLAARKEAEAFYEELSDFIDYAEIALAAEAFAESLK
ncbi:hypothetical protein UFOVP158_19 [uncultured Caudovirales phage]|uniref:Uncharacterized protein n=1 Tax=uncultured Caudovirales phage TaxID=2100421 RepID=A0A6J7WG69_9CAUD|nr:hypothetical protein UFOVP158_19 [uncultured Caudovirales phage]